MENVVPFTPKTRFDFEGAALRRLTLLASMAVRLPELLDWSECNEDDRRALQPAFDNLISIMSFIELALDYLEEHAPRLITEFKPGEQKEIKTANDNSKMRVIMMACVRCEILYVNDLRLEKISVKLRSRVA